MVTCEQISVVSNFFSSVSLVSWICAQLPQIYANYTSKSAEGISPSFLLLWFMGDFLSFTSCLLNDEVLQFQVYLSLFFICNDITLCYQYYYYNSVYPKKYAHVQPGDPHAPHSQAAAAAARGYSSEIAKDADFHRNSDFEQYSQTADANPYTSESIQIHATAARTASAHNRASESDKDRPIAEYLSSSGSPSGSYNSINNSPNRQSTPTSAIKALAVGAVLNSSTTNALAVAIGTAASTAQQDAAVSTASFSLISRSTLGSILAWACTCVYVSSRCPQLYKNYKRKSVDGISPLLFGSALLGNLTYTLSIVTSCSFLFADTKSSFIMKELPYILGSSGTILFDVAYFYQRYIYRFSGRNTLVMELEGDVWTQEGR